MTVLRHIEDHAVCKGVSQAVAAACECLDVLFPGRDARGITSNFQGLLEEVVLQMLLGRSVLDSRRGHTVALPQLVIDDGFFGRPLDRGELFLACKPSAPGSHKVLALDPDGEDFKALDGIGDAWTSYEAAARAARRYFVRKELTLEQAHVLELQVRAVEMIANAERGYALSTAGA